MIKRLDFLVKPVKGSDVIMDRFLWLIFQRNKLLECVALTQHRNVSKIGFERSSYITDRFAVSDQLKFGFDNGRNKNTHGITIGDLPCDESFCFIIVIRWIDLANDDVIQIFLEFNLAFEASLLVGSPRESVDRTYDGV